MTNAEDRAAAATAGRALPTAVDDLIPHRTPMRVIDTLCAREGNGGVTASCLPDTSILADERGVLDDVVFAELVAQSYAAVRAHGGRPGGRPARGGLLVGIRDLRVTGQARTGDELVTAVRTVGEVQGFAVVEGEVSRSGEILARGTITVWDNAD